MHRLRRKIVLTWMSGVLCTLAMLFWTRSFWTLDALDLMSRYQAASFISAEGGLHIQRLLFHYTLPDWMAQPGIAVPHPSSSWMCVYDRFDADVAMEYVGPADDMGGRWGFWFVNDWHAPRWNTESPPYPDDGWTLRIPWWAVVLATGILPLMALFDWVQQERPRRRGFCPECGYDLRATPTRCPECGYVPRVGGRSLLKH
jgi:hypothetical protein